MVSEMVRFVRELMRSALSKMSADERVAYLRESNIDHEYALSDTNSERRDTAAGGHPAMPDVVTLESALDESALWKTVVDVMKIDKNDTILEIGW